MRDSQKNRKQHSSELVEARQQLNILAAEAEGNKAGQKLKQLEEKFYKAFQSSPEAIAIVSAKDEKYIDINDNYLKMFGYSREELLGKKAFLDNWVNPEDHTKMHRMIQEYGRICNEEFDYRTKSGEIRTRLLSLEPIIINGEPCRIGFSLDITERKMMEQALIESEEKFSKAFRALPEQVTIVRMKDEVFIDVNESFCRYNGYTREEVIGRKREELNLLIGPSQRNQIKQMVKELGRFKNIELECRDKTGETRTLLFSADIINIGGEPCQLTIANDITERKQMEQALKESEEKFSKAFHASPEAVAIVTEKDERYVDVNDTYTKMTGYSREELIGKTVSSINIWVNPEGHTKMRKMMRERGRIYNEEFDYHTKSGEIRTRLFSMESIAINSEPCTIGVSTDITDYKRMETQAHEVENLKKVDKLRTEFLANVSHELRTPLASIKGFATMLMDYDKRLTSAEKREYLETIDKNSDRLVELIEQLLEMSRLGAGMLSIKKAPADIAILCKTAINEVRIRAPGYTFRLDLSPKLPKTSIDNRRIREVLDHIIDNAVKYSNPGTEIKLSVQKNDSDILFTVSDHGIGISKSDLPQVFDRMFHSTLGQKTGVAGAGLGLAICKGLIEAHGGKIWLESEEGIGTKCFFTLPIESSDLKKKLDDPEENTIVVVKKKRVPASGE